MRHLLPCILTIIALALLGCAPVASQPGAAALQPTQATTAAPTSEPPAATAEPLAPAATTTPSPPTATPTDAAPTPTPNPLAGWTVDDLAARTYGGTGIQLGEVVKSEASFTQFVMTYDSDGLTITGLANIPTGEGTFPTVIVAHGFCNPDTYWSGCDSVAVADSLARNGYIALAPDYRGYGESDDGPNPFRIGYAVDVMNLAAQVTSLPQAAGAVGIIGHSMGGGVAQWPMVLQSDVVGAVVLYAAMSGDIATNWRHIRMMWDTGSQDALAASYGTPEENPEGYAAASPTSYLDRVAVPVMIHHGTLDDQVPHQWSVELTTALRAAGKDVTFYSYEGEPHTFLGPTFDLFMQRNVAFFDEHLRPTP